MVHTTWFDPSLTLWRFETEPLWLKSWNKKRDEMMLPSTPTAPPPPAPPTAPPPQCGMTGQHHGTATATWHSHGIKVDDAAVLAVNTAALHDYHAQARVAVDEKTDYGSEGPHAWLQSPRFRGHRAKKKQTETGFKKAKKQEQKNANKGMIEYRITG
jgi:hypothetical protein